MKILVVDDENNFCSLVTEVLSREGYEVVPFANSLRAWDYLRSEGADMAVLDVNMPGMDGIELLWRIRGDARLKDIPVLFLSVRGLTEDQVRGYNVGVDDYLPKPFPNEVLVARVKVLERRIVNRPV